MHAHMPLTPSLRTLRPASFLLPSHSPTRSSTPLDRTPQSLDPPIQLNSPPPRSWRWRDGGLNVAFHQRELPVSILRFKVSDLSSAINKRLIT
eukprot:3146497-Rhodomonas_salina.2